MNGKAPKPLMVAFGAPWHGWLTMTLSANGRDHQVDFSYIYPSLSRLCEALRHLWLAERSSRTVFLEEPSEVEATFDALGDGRCRLRLVRYPNHRRVLTPDPLLELDGNTREMVVVFWRALRQLQTCLPPEAFKTHWLEPFPEAEMTSLTELVANRR